MVSLPSSSVGTLLYLFIPVFGEMEGISVRALLTASAESLFGYVADRVSLLHS